MVEEEREILLVPHHLQLIIIRSISCDFDSKKKFHPTHLPRNFDGTLNMEEVHL